MSRLALAFVLGFVFSFAYVSTSQAATVVCKGGVSWYETCKGTDNADQITGSVLSDDIYGKGGGDQITSPADWSCRWPGFAICADNGDLIHGGGGADLIVLGSAPACPDGYTCLYDYASIDSGDGDDTIHVEGRPNLDTVDCGGGRDTVYADPADTIGSNCEQVTRVP